MKQRTKNYLLATIVAAIIGTGLTVSCASQKLSVTQNSAEIVPSVNAKPEVVWSEDPAENKFYENKTFLIPDEYFVQKPSGNYDSLQTIVLSMPDLKPLPSLKRRCRMDMPNLKCLQGVLEVQFGHDLNRQVFKDKGINEDNYLNYYFDKSRVENQFGIDESIYLKSTEKKYSLTPYYYDAKKIPKDKVDSNNTGGFVDYYFDFSGTGSVKTVLECSNKEASDESIIKNKHMATCTHTFIIKPHKMVLNMIYERKYLPQWQQIQTAVINLINQFHQNASTKQGGK
jgi:hypothetical protein